MINKQLISPQQAFKLKRNAPHFLFVIFRTLFFIGMAYVVLYPVLVMLSRAFRTPDDMLNPQVVWLPQNFTLDNFKIVAEMTDFYASHDVTAVMPTLASLMPLAAQMPLALSTLGVAV